MSSIQKCPQCGHDITDTSAAVCPMCGTTYGTMSGATSGSTVVAGPGARIWIGALVQFAIATIFMLKFGFPKIMIAFFGGFIVLGTALSAYMKAKPVAVRPAPQLPTAHPVLYRILGLIIALCSLAFVATLLFGFVIFMNSWSRWHLYEGQRHHQTEFQVTRAYYQKGRKGSIDIYASGMVEGQREWMNLQPYLHTMPHDQEELDAHVSAGTSIPIYLFPDLKGRSRVQVYEETAPAEAYRRAAMKAINYGLGGLALCAAMIFVLSRVRRMCFDETDSSLQIVARS